MRLILGIIFLSALSAHASTETDSPNGGVAGGGGKTVVCRNADGSIRSAEVLDLYEGKAVYGLSYQETSSPWQEQALRMLQVFDFNVYRPNQAMTTWRFNRIVSKLRELPQGIVLQPVNDSSEVIAPVGCGLEQTINYQNDNLILLDGNIWRALSETQKAALMVHETLYRTLRNYNEKDSRRARHLTAHLFAGQQLEHTELDSSEIRENRTVLCENDVGSSSYPEAIGNPLYTAFYVQHVYKGKPGKQSLRITFLNIAGRLLLSRTTMNFPYFEDDAVINQILEKFLKPSTGNVADEGYDFILGQSELFPTESLFEGADNIDIRGGSSSVILKGVSGFDGSILPQIYMKCRESKVVDGVEPSEPVPGTPVDPEDPEHP